MSAVKVLKPRECERRAKIEGKRGIIIEDGGTEPVMRQRQPARIDCSLAELRRKLLEPDEIDPEAVVEPDRTDSRRKSEGRRHQHQRCKGDKGLLSLCSIGAVGADPVRPNPLDRHNHSPGNSRGNDRLWLRLSLPAALEVGRGSRERKSGELYRARSLEGLTRARHRGNVAPSKPLHGAPRSRVRTLQQKGTNAIISIRRSQMRQNG